MGRSSKKRTGALSPEEKKRRYVEERIGRLHRLIDLCGAGEAYRSLPAKDRAYLERVRSPLPEIAGDPGIPRECLQYFREYLGHVLDRHMVPIGAGGQSIRLRDFFSAGMVLLHSVKLFRKEEHPQAESWARALSVLLALDEVKSTDTQLFQLMFQLNFAGWAFSDSELGHYFTTMELATPLGDEVLTGFRFIIHHGPPELRRFTIDGKKRTGFRVQFNPMGDNKMIPCVLSTRVIPGLEAQDERELPVYIQRHVYHRVEERMKPSQMTIFEEELAISIRNPEVTALPDGAFLIAMQYYMLRIGYLVAEVIEDAVLLRTFLFLTQSGTPEGDRFNERLRIGNYEKRWFDLDRFAGFAGTDLCEDPVFMELLKDCNLEGIQELVRLERSLNRKHDPLRQHGEQVRKILLAQSRFAAEPDDEDPPGEPEPSKAESPCRFVPGC